MARHQAQAAARVLADIGIERHPVLGASGSSKTWASSTGQLVVSRSSADRLAGDASRPLSRAPARSPSARAIASSDPVSPQSAREASL